MALDIASTYSWDNVIMRKGMPTTAVLPREHKHDHAKALTFFPIVKFKNGKWHNCTILHAGSLNDPIDELLTTI